MAGSGENDHPLMDALQFPDRLVRYEAAFAAGRPPCRGSRSPGQERIVPLLAEALSQTGAANVLVMAPTREELATLTDGLKGAGYNVGRRDQPQRGPGRGGQAAGHRRDPHPRGPSARPPFQQLEVLAAQTPRLQRAVKVIITRTKASPYTVRGRDRHDAGDDAGQADRHSRR